MMIMALIFYVSHNYNYRNSKKGHVWCRNDMFCSHESLEDVEVGCHQVVDTEGIDSKFEWIVRDFVVHDNQKYGGLKRIEMF